MHGFPTDDNLTVALRPYLSRLMHGFPTDDKLTVALRPYLSRLMHGFPTDDNLSTYGRRNLPRIELPSTVIILISFVSIFINLHF